jgi:hypothetical protein
LLSGKPEARKWVFKNLAVNRHQPVTTSKMDGAILNGREIFATKPKKLSIWQSF